MPHTALIDRIRAVSRPRHRPDDSAYQSLYLADALGLARETGLSLADIERQALSMDVLPERYSRNQKILSCSDQLKLLNSHVVIVGLGGLGGTVAEILARLGVGRLTLVDGDVFDESNLNRQLHSSCSNLGRSKAAVTAVRVNDINPAIAVHPVSDFLTTANGRQILGQAMLGVDCLDNIPDRFLLEEACRSAGIPLVSAAIAGTSGQAAVILPDGPGLERIYGPKDKVLRRGIEATVGTLPYTAMFIATIQCSEIAGLLLGRQTTLSGKLLLAQLDECDMTIVSW